MCFTQLPPNQLFFANQYTPLGLFGAAHSRFKASIDNSHPQNTDCVYCIHKNSPILLIAKFRTVTYVDGSDVTVCLTQALDIWTTSYFLMTISLFFLLPLAVLVVLYSIIARHLISSDGAMLMVRPSKPEQSQRARKQVVFMLGAVVLSFFLCLLPFRILTLLVILVSEEHWKTFKMEHYYNVLYFCRVMLYLNSAVNPILYNLMSSKFRKGFRKVYCCFFWKSRTAGDGRTSGGVIGALNPTSSSFLTHSSSGSRKSEAHKTVSLDDLRGEPLIVRAALKRTISSDTHRSQDEYRKLALANFNRQMRSIEVHDNDQRTSRRLLVAESRSQSVSGKATCREKQLVFQYSLDESRIRGVRSVADRGGGLD